VEKVELVIQIHVAAIPNPKSEMSFGSLAQQAHPLPQPLVSFFPPLTFHFWRHLHCGRL